MTSWIQAKPYSPQQSVVSVTGEETSNNLNSSGRFSTDFKPLSSISKYTPTLLPNNTSWNQNDSSTEKIEWGKKRSKVLSEEYEAIRKEQHASKIWKTKEEINKDDPLLIERFRSLSEIQKLAAWKLACISGSLKKVQTLIDLGFDPTVTDGLGNSGLHFSAQNFDNEKTFKYLLSLKKIDITLKNKVHLMALDILIQKHGASAIPLAFDFIQKGVQISNESTKKELWEHAIQINQIKILLEKKIFYSIKHFQTTPLHVATIRESDENFEYLLNFGQLPVNHQNEYGLTSLSLLCASDLVYSHQSSALKRIDLLLQKGADVNIVDRLNQSCLLILSNNFWHREEKEIPENILHRLLRAGAQTRPTIDFYKALDWKDEKKMKYTTGGYYNYTTEQKIGNSVITWRHEGSAPIQNNEFTYWTTKHYRKEKAPKTFQILKNNKTKEGKTSSSPSPLSDGSSKPHPINKPSQTNKKNLVKQKEELTREELRIASSYLDDPSCKGDKERALHDAIFAKDSKGVGALTKFGSDPNSLGLGTNTNFAQACFFGIDIKVLEKMLQKGANPNVYKNNEPLINYMSQFNKNANIVKLLLNWGADPNLPCEEGKNLGKTALHLAVEQLGVYNLTREEFEDICILMLEKGADPNARFMSSDSSPSKTLFEEVLEVRSDRVARAFLKAGFNLNAPDLFLDNRLLDLVLRNGWEDFLNIMLEKMGIND